MVTKAELLKCLPPASLIKKKVADRQSVPLIMELVVRSHRAYRSHYDRIAKKFWKGSVKKTAGTLFDFCKSEMMYLAESSKQQTVRSPAAILNTCRTWGVDCKHYAGFIGGVLDALKRQGKKVNWCYMFVSYDETDETPEHVFISVEIDGQSFFIDPVVGTLNCRYPKFYYFQQKYPSMSLYTVNGIRQRTRVGAIELERSEMDYTAPNYVTQDRVITTMQPTTTGAPGGEITTAPNASAGTIMLGSAVEIFKKYWWVLAAGVGIYYLTKKKK